MLALLAAAAVFAGCGESAEKAGYNTDKDIHDMVKAVTDVLSYDGLVQEILYKESDPDEMVKWTYGVVDINAESHLKDYAITLPTDYNNTLAVFVFDGEMTDADYQEVKDAVKENYIEARKSSLQMYMPEEYDAVKWQLENLDLVWRQYDNVLVLCEYNKEEPTAAWDALEALFAK